MQAHTLRFPSLTAEHPAERVLRAGLLVLLALLLACYVYLIASSTFNIIARKQALQEGMATQSTLSRINAEYYALSSTLTEERAAHLGLVPLEEKEYVTRASQLGFADGQR